jgi:beta-lactam-binding protein with PASTA domain
MAVAHPLPLGALSSTLLRSKAMRSPLLRILLPIIVAGLILLAGWVWLRTYTRHSTAVRVPDLKGLSMEESVAMLSSRELQAMVIDSVYIDDLPKGSVVDQSPVAGVDVKPERKVYLVLNANEPKMLDMPDLIDLSKRQAISVLEIIGLKVKDLQYIPDPCVDCVVDQLYKGEPIAPEARIRRGESVTLVLGSGDKGERVPIPELFGLTSMEVAKVLNMASLNLGIVVECVGCNTRIDSTLARVRRQSPQANNSGMIAMGSMIDIWLTTDTAGVRPAPGWDDPTRYMKTDSTDAED